LIAAVHTPMRADGSLRIEQVDRQLAHLLKCGVRAVFVAGTTGEGLSLTVDERIELAGRWIDAARGTGLDVLVHVGHNSLPAARALAAHAMRHRAAGIAAMAPCYFRPDTVTRLVDWLEEIAGAAPALPFYYYDIPILTGVSLSMTEFLAEGQKRIPSLEGIKYTNDDLEQFGECVRFDEGVFDILFGCDEVLLDGLLLGARGAIGSSYNYAAPLYERIIAHHAAGNLEAAREEQDRSAAMIDLIAGYGYQAAAKSVMAMIGVDCGPARLPVAPMPPERIPELRRDLEEIGFFDWALPGKE
jgi:N-acetylneuraminate lyase